MTAWQTIFWLSISVIAYCYLLYPLILWSWAKLSAPEDPTRPTRSRPAEWPFVSLVIAAYKEERVILERVQNALLMDYPADRIEIIIGCDGAEDATGDLVQTVDDSRIKLMQFPKRRGKPAVLNDCVAAARGDIIAFSDANTFWDRGALRILANHFEAETVGGVCGQLILTDPVTGKNVDGMYWRYENFLKRCEGRIGALLGANGAIYAIRRDNWAPIPVNTIVDDFLIGMRVHLSGNRLVFDESARATEESAPSMEAEFHRRARIGAGGFQSLCWLRQLLNPLRSPAGWPVAFAFWSHKVLRWICPLFLVLALLANTCLLSLPLYRVLFVCQFGFWAMALCGHLIPGSGTASRLLRLSSMFVSMNLALAVGFWRWLRNSQSGVWKRTARSAETQPTNKPRPQVPTTAS